MLHNASGVVLISFTTLIGVRDSNQGNNWATKEALRIFNASFFSHFVESDSFFTITWVTSKRVPLKFHFIHEIKHLCSFLKVDFVHTPRS